MTRPGAVFTDPDTTVYLVFARLRAEDPLGLLGTVSATNLGLARAYARTTYDEDRWIEICVVPRDALSWVKKVEDV